MKSLITIFIALFMFGAGYLAGEYKGSYGACKNNNTLVSKIFGEKDNPALQVYTKATCPYCVSAKSLLMNHDIDYSEIDISGDSQLKAEMIQKAKGRKTVPQIFVGDTHIGGFDDLQTIIETFKPCAKEDN